MKKGGGSASTIIIGSSKFVLVYALHSLEYVLGLARFRVFVPNIYIYIYIYIYVNEEGIKVSAGPILGLTCFIFIIYNYIFIFLCFNIFMFLYFYIFIYLYFCSFISSSS